MIAVRRGVEGIVGCLGYWVGLFLAVWPLMAVEPAEQSAFDAALRDFETGLWERADRQFSDFEAQFPQSTLRAEVDQRRAYAVGEIKMARKEFGAAADQFAEFQKAFSASPRAALAAVREATARFKAGDPAAAVAVLQKSDGPFAHELQAGKELSLIYSGLMVKAESLFVIKEYSKAEETLELAGERSAQSPREKWERLRLSVLVREAAGKPERALEAAQSLVALAADDASLADRRAPSYSFAALLAVRLKNDAKAREWFEQNLAPETPVEFQREATLYVASRAVASQNWAYARQQLESFLVSHPTDTNAAQFRLILGRAIFRQYQGTVQSLTNTADAASLLAEASLKFQEIITNTPAGEFTGSAYLGRGWCLWVDAIIRQGTNRLKDAEAHFARAAELLPHGTEQAEARFKYADCLMDRGAAVEALTNYLAVAEGYADVPENTPRVEVAWQQTALSATQAHRLDAAMKAVDRLLALNPRAEATAQTVLAVGQALIKAQKLDDARGLLSRFSTAVPDSKFRPDAQLALASADYEDRRWTNVVVELGDWIRANTNHPKILPARWYLALARAKAGELTNAVTEFTELASRFPTEPAAVQAVWWLADSYFNNGEYDRAEQACFTITTNAAWKGRPEWYRAFFRQAEAAYRRQNWTKAGEMLFEFLNHNADAQMPSDLPPPAFLLLGDYHRSRPPESGESQDAILSKAFEAYKGAVEFAAKHSTNSPIRPLALKAMADCNLQQAVHDTNFYQKAVDLYQRVLMDSVASSELRASASIGLAQCYSHLADRFLAAGKVTDGEVLRTRAIDHLLDVVHGRYLNANERADASSIGEAGARAGEMMEASGKWSEAASLYDRLAEELAAMRPRWLAKAAFARKQAGG
jgi:outer membrane protein assembly factor BamD (BamD/ComL family)